MGLIFTHGLITRITRALSFTLLTKKPKSQVSTITIKVTNNKSSHDNKRHFNSSCISFFSSLKYSDAKRHYLQRNPHTPLRPVKRGVTRSMRPAAGLGGPPLTWSTVAVRAAIVTFAQSAVQNVLDVLYYQVDGHKVICSSGNNHICILLCW